MTQTRTRPTLSASRATGSLVGVGVGAVILDEAGRVLLLRRGARARNEQGMWACPGGALAVGETLEEAIVREVQEECGLVIAVLCQIGAFDHMLPDGEQWVSIAYLAQVVGGEPVVREPGKCSACAWFALDTLPEPLSPLACIQLAAARLLIPAVTCPQSPCGVRTWSSLLRRCFPGPKRGTDRPGSVEQASSFPALTTSEVFAHSQSPVQGI